MSEFGRHSVSNVWISAFGSDQAAIQNRAELTAQTETFSCGAACLVDVIKGHNPNSTVTEQEMIDEIRRMHESEGRDIDSWGTPPELVKRLLDQHVVPYEEYHSKKTLQEITAEDLLHAKQRLEQFLAEGKVCMVCIQSTPDYWYRDEKTHELSTGKPADPIDSNYSIVRVNNSLWDGASVPIEAVQSERGAAASTKGDPTFQGHWIVVTGMMQRDGKEYYVTHDPWYQAEQAAVNKKALELEQPLPIDAKFVGIRLMAKNYFLSRWHDVAGDNETEFNQYLLAIETISVE